MALKAVMYGVISCFFVIWMVHEKILKIIFGTK
jgi:hypothetical protein